MRKLLLFLCALLAGVSGAWAAVSPTTIQASQITSAEDLTDGTRYVIRVNTGSYITEGSGQYEAPNAQNAITANAVFTFIKDGDAWKVKNDATGNYWGTLTGAATGTFAPADEESAGSWTFTFNASNVDAESGGYHINRSSGVMHGWGSAINLQIYTVETVNLVTDMGDLSNDKAYYITTAGRGSWYVPAEGTAITSTTKAGVASSKNDTKQQFAFLTYGTTGVYHLYSVSEGKFVSKSEDYTTLTNEVGDNATLLNSTSASYPFVIALNDGANQLGISNGYDPAVISFWNSLSDGGNQVQIIEVADFDPTAALAVLEAAYSTTVKVTYELYEDDGTTLVKSVDVIQDKNSEVSIPDAWTSSIYDYTPVGTIGTTDCTIKVTRTLKAGIVYPISGLSNTKSYYVKTRDAKRGALSTYTDDGTTYLASSVKSALDIAPKTFAILNYGEHYYLYSVEDKKFVSPSSELAAMPTGTSDAITFYETSKPLYQLRFDDSKIINSSGNYAHGIVVNSWGASESQWDDGCQYTIEEADDFDPTAALAALKEVYHPAYTVRYVVVDGSDNVLFTSEPVRSALNENITTLPEEYQLTNFYTYNTVDVTVTETGTTDVKFTATPVETPIIQYTADATTPNYYNLKIRGMYLIYNPEATGEVTLQQESEPFNPNASWAFIGEPYTGFKLINKTVGTDNFLTYTSVITDGNGGSDGSNNNIQFVANADFTDQYWLIDKNTGGFVLRMKENTDIYFHHQNISGQTGYLRTCSKAEWSAVHNDAGSTIVASTDGDVLFALYDELKNVQFGEEIGIYSAEGMTVAATTEAIAAAGSVIANKETAVYAETYTALKAIKSAIKLNTPVAGNYRLRNVYTDMYLYATKITGYNSAERTVFANCEDKNAATVISLVEKEDGKLYMYNQGAGFGWTVGNKSVGAGLAYLTSNPDKYVNWLPGNQGGQIAFAICYGNGTGNYADYLTQGIYMVDASDDAVVGGSNYTADIAQWVFEEVTKVTIPLNSLDNKNYYGTFCAPFDISLNNASAYTLTLDADGTTLNLSTASEEVEAGTPVLLVSDKKKATASIGTQYVTTSPSTETALKGTYLPVFNFDGEKNFVLGTDKAKVGFFYWKGTELGANRAYVAGNADSGVKGYYLNLDDTDAIKALVSGTENGAVYNLSGQRVQKAQKGIYLMSGKKIMVK